jgi:hypothetical protein
MDDDFSVCLRDNKALTKSFMSFRSDKRLILNLPVCSSIIFLHLLGISLLDHLLFYFQPPCLFGLASDIQNGQLNIEANYRKSLSEVKK